ncbi:MAG: hypothetical protein ACI3YI_07055 [Bacteroidaceae bacterium]
MSQTSAKMFPTPTNGLKTGGEKRLLTREKSFCPAETFSSQEKCVSLPKRKIRIACILKNPFQAIAYEQENPTNLDVHNVHHGDGGVRHPERGEIIRKESGGGQND